MTEYWNEFKIVFGGDFFDQLLLISMTIHLISTTTHQNQLPLTEYRNECKIVFGGDCFDQFASEFDDHSS